MLNFLPRQSCPGKSQALPASFHRHCRQGGDAKGIALSNLNKLGVIFNGVTIMDENSTYLIRNRFR